MSHIPVCVMPHAGGWHLASWRRPGTRGNDIWNFDLWRHIAQTAERGRLDAVFMADNQGMWPVTEELRHHTAKVGTWDALVLTSAMATVTDRIGLVATAHTEFHEPYALARQLACLDHLSGGRAGWNIVTSAGDHMARNFNAEGQLPTDVRYAKATEFVELTKRLWDSWEDDAYLIDQEAGVYYDPQKLHPTRFSGEHYFSDGPLNVMRPPQGYPVLAQAGASGPGRQLAGTTGELVFTPLTGQAGREYREDLHRIAQDSGRRPEDIRVLGQITPVIAPTDEEAEAKWAWLQERLHPDLQRGVIESLVGVDVRDFPLDEPLPELGETKRVQGYRDAALNFRIDGRKPTLRELLTQFKGPGTVVGSPTTIADYMQEQLDQGACDGFVLCLQGCPDELEDFVDLVVPELQRRGAFRREYEHDTLRGHLGLRRPANQFAGASADSAETH